MYLHRLSCDCSLLMCNKCSSDGVDIQVDGDLALNRDLAGPTIGGGAQVSLTCALPQVCTHR